MAVEIEQEFNMIPKLIEGSGGVFEVELNNELIFSKRNLKRFPSDDEVQQIIREKIF